MIDLHLHSTCSDGSLTPRQLAEEVRRAGVSAAALADHDTVAGVSEFLEACSERGIKCAAAVEISAQSEVGPLHILGYFIKPDSPELTANLAFLCKARIRRNRLIIGKLNELGMELAESDVAALAGGDVVGRSHIAAALVQKGYVKSVAVAFKRYLGQGGKAYFERERLTAADGIRLMRSAGGLAALAHPATLHLTKPALKKLLAALKDTGLQALEVFYPTHTPQMVSEYSELARKLGLAPTGGSDFHGATKPGIKIGTGFGGMSVPDELYERLLQLQKR